MLSPKPALKIGNRRLKAVQQILGKATPKSWETLQLHLVWSGDYALSALSDECLGLGYIWPGCMPPQELLSSNGSLRPSIG